jgi:hypothetical protein
MACSIAAQATAEVARRHARAPIAYRAWSSRMSITHARVPSARATWVASICHKSLGTGRSNRRSARRRRRP